MFVRISKLSRWMVIGLVAASVIGPSHVLGQTSYQVLPDATETQELVFLSEARYSPANDYDATSVTTYRAPGGLGTVATAESHFGGVLAYTGVNISGWQDEAGAKQNVVTSFDLSSTLAVAPAFGPVRVYSKSIELPSSQLDLQDVGLGDSETYADSNLEVQLLESFIFHSFESQASDASLYIWNESTEEWDLISNTDLSDANADFDFGLFSFDESLDLSVDSNWIHDFGNNTYGVQLKVELEFEDSSQVDVTKDLPLWSVNSGPGGGPGMNP